MGKRVFPIVRILENGKSFPFGTKVQLNDNPPIDRFHPIGSKDGGLHEIWRIPQAAAVDKGISQRIG